MAIELKALSAEAIPRALEKAERYRLLNQPWAARCGHSSASHRLIALPTSEVIILPFV